jgi:uncharacterized protein (DUF362 family)
MGKVIIRKCDSYEEREKIVKIINEGIEKLGLKEKIKGKIVIKPNVVLAHKKVAPSAFTRPEIIDSLIKSIKSLKSEKFSFVVIENSGTGIPTSRMFRKAGYFSLRKNHPELKLSPFEESIKVRVPLKKGKVHKEIKVQKDLVEKDFLIYAPKLKTNVLSHGITSAIKLNIGILGDKERMKFHTYQLPEKIVDLLEVGYPDLIVTDAIEIAMGGNQMTEHSLNLGIILISNHPLSHDVVCAHILNLKPEEIPVLKEAEGRGYGSLNFNEIEIDTDIPLEELKKRTSVRENGFRRVDSVEGPVKVFAGEPYCFGGCHGVFLDWLYMLKDRAPLTFEKKKDIAVVIGEVEGDVKAKKVIIVGNCSKVKGNIKAKKISKIKGCPTRHKDIILYLLLKAGIKSPLFRIDLLIDAYPFLFLSNFKGFLKNFFFLLRKDNILDNI